MTSDITSYRGYSYLAANLATHGYVVASISANTINSYDLALLATDSGMRWRAELIAATLDRLADWNVSRGPGEVTDRLIGKLDLTRIGVMGHSRGGEGAALFPSINRTRAEPHEGLRAVFALAPTNFFDQRVEGVHFATAIPMCDGDVRDLQGARMFDDTRFLEPQDFARVQFVMRGASHNAYNTIWTFDDGAFSPNKTACDPARNTNVRLSAQEQRMTGLALMAAFIRRYVGDEVAFDPYVTGEAPLPDGACPGARPTCRDAVLTSYVGPDHSSRFVIAPGTSGHEASGALRVTGCAPNRRSGSGCGSAPNRSPTPQLRLSWDGPGGLTVPFAEALDASTYRSLTFRTAVNFSDGLNGGSGQDLEVILTDTSERVSSVSAAAYTSSLLPPDGLESRQTVLNGVRIPMDSFSGVDLSQIDRVTLRFGVATETGSIQLIDLGFQEGRASPA